MGSSQRQAQQANPATSVTTDSLTVLSIPLITSATRLKPRYIIGQNAMSTVGTINMDTVTMSALSPNS